MMRFIPLVSLSLCACMAKMPATLEFTSAEAAAPVPEPLLALAPSPFARDRFTLTEEQLAAALSATTEVSPRARIGIVRVADGYAPENSLPLDATTQVLADALDTSGVVTGASEVSTEWPAESGLPGLRELSARYRARYLLLYRQRFVSSTRPNGWATGYLTLVGALFMPGTTYEQHGVLEATLFDAMTGTVLFTVHERVGVEAMAAPPAVVQAMRASQAALVKEGAPKLAAEVVARCRKLARRDSAAAEAVSVISGK